MQAEWKQRTSCMYTEQTEHSAFTLAACWARDWTTAECGDLQSRDFAHDHRNTAMMDVTITCVVFFFYDKTESSTSAVLVV